MLQIIPIPAFKDNYIWLLHNGTPACVVIDPGDATPVLRYLAEQRLHLSAILLTHHHNDHCGGVSALLEQFNIPVFGPAQDGIKTITQAVRHGQTVALPKLGSYLQVLEVPGHTAGHIAYYGHGALFCGDTLFLAGCGRLFEGTAEQMYHSLCLLAELPDDTQVYCAHEYTLANLAFARVVEPDNQAIMQRIQYVESQRNANMPSVPATLATEKATNPFLRCHLPVVQRAAEQLASKPLNNAIEVFQVIRSWKDIFKL
jgi:hydroxyacylglutathione hydrolase